MTVARSRGSSAGSGEAGLKLGRRSPYAPVELLRDHDPPPSDLILNGMHHWKAPSRTRSALLRSVECVLFISRIAAISVST
jgi:hypothetical protein